MPANVEPIFALRPEIKRAVITGATTDKSGAVPTNIVELLTAETDGTKITWIKFKHVANSSAGRYLIWITDQTGASPRLFAELASALATSSVSASTDENTLFTPDLQLKIGQKILVGATVATSNIHVTAQVGHFS